MATIIPFERKAPPRMPASEEANIDHVEAAKRLRMLIRFLVIKAASLDGGLLSLPHALDDVREFMHGAMEALNDGDGTCWS